MPDRNELKRLDLQIERDVCAHASLQTLVAAAKATIVSHRQDLQIVKARIKRAAKKHPSRQGS